MIQMNLKINIVWFHFFNSWDWIWIILSCLNWNSSRIFKLYITMYLYGYFISTWLKVLWKILRWCNGHRLKLMTRQISQWKVKVAFLDCVSYVDRFALHRFWICSHYMIFMHLSFLHVKIWPFLPYQLMLFHWKFDIW